jgi:RHS repeat-associated protein
VFVAHLRAAPARNRWILPCSFDVRTLRHAQRRLRPIYDASHRLSAVEDALGNRIDYTLDKSGHRTGEVVTNDAGAVKRQLTRVFDQLGRLDLEKNAALQVIADHGYDAGDNPTSTVDALGYETRQTFDPLDRLKQTIQDYGGVAAQSDYVYDALDQLTRVTDPKGLSTDYGYDGLGNLRTLTSPDTGVTSYTPDAAGNVVSQTDARGVVRNSTYDVANRLKTVSYVGSAGLNTTFVYDMVNPSCAAGETFALGRLTRMTDASGSTDYCYNRFGQRVRKVQTNNGVVQTTRYGYSLGGHLVSMVYPSGMQLTYGRNAAGQISSVTVTPVGGIATNVITSTSYLPFGPVTSLVYGSGRTQTRAYDTNYGIDAISNPASGGLMLDFGLDLAGNPSEVISGASGNRFDYDSLNRLEGVTSLTNAPLETYTYDGTGNRLSKKLGAGTPQAYLYPAGSHRLSSVGGVARSYDAAGNATQTASNKIFTYDARSRLVEFRTGTQANKLVSSYQYNGRDERVRKYKGSVDQGRYGYDEAGMLLFDQTISGGSTTTTELVWLDDLPVATVRNGVVYYVESDHLGTPRSVIDIQRNVAVWTWVLLGNPFGEGAPNQNPDGDGQNFVFGLRFPGQYFDQETGLHYNYFRDYESSTGRYIESDPNGLLGGMSTFGYASAAPTSQIDPYGLESAPVFDPRLNLSPSWLGANNCYSYAINRGGKTGHPLFGGSGLQPGESSGEKFTSVTCADIRAAAIRDGAMEAEKGEACGASCPEGYHLIKLMITDKLFRNDYHWFRQDADGSWSSKQGVGAVRKHGRSCPGKYFDYVTDCGVLCAKN